MSRHLYTHLTDFLEEGSSGFKNEPKKASSLAKNTVLWYPDFVNYPAVGVLPPDLTYHQKKKLFNDLKQYYWDDLFYSREESMVFSADVSLMMKLQVSSSTATPHHMEGIWVN
jgi:hypothetical protein